MPRRSDPRTCRPAAVVSARARQTSDRESRLRGPAPAGPRGTRSGPQAAGDVHRIDRHPRADALPVGDHRQLRRRGARRPRAATSPSPCAPTAASPVTDHGRGIPVDIEPRTGLSGSRWSTPSCTPAGSSAPGPTTRPAVCTASARRWSTRCRPGWTSRSIATVPPGRCRSGGGRRAPSTGPGPTATFTAGGTLRKIGRAAKGLTGTRVTYWPDRQIFLKDAQLSLKDLEDRARQTSFLVPGLALAITDAAHGRGHRAGLQARRRHLRVLRVPGPRPGA